MTSISSVSSQAAVYALAGQMPTASPPAPAPTSGNSPAATVQISAQARQLAAQSADKDHDGDSK